MLTIFPDESLASAVTTTVWIGVWVVVFYNLRLGWSASGLVVPGYLVPLLLIKPVAAGVVLGEGVVTYLIVKLICHGREVKPWTTFFGRDRFFALLVVAILVRCALDGWALPWLADLMADRFDWKLAFRDDLHSFGLIIVALVANYFWKPGIRRGVIPLAITIGTTFLIVRFVLIEWTNFSIGNLQYMYEDIAASLLASPKAYIVLITTAYIASWMNLRYGWEFCGILIPALLALQWHVPSKILTTFAETFLILVFASLILKIPPLSRTNIEGSRKTLLFFNIAFAFRIALGHVVPDWLPSMKVSDLYGFGYLLSTLLAVRIHAIGILFRVPRVSIQVSIVGVLAGSLLGFILTLLPGSWMWASDRSLVVEAIPTHRPDQRLIDWVRAEKPRLYRQRIPNSFVIPTVADLTRFTEGLNALKKFCHTHGTESDLTQARTLLRKANYELFLLEDRFWVLAEKEPARGWGFYAIDRTRPNALLVEVPAPIDEWGTAESGVALMLRTEAGTLAVGGSGLRTNRDGSADVLNRPRTLFSVFHRAFAQGNVLQVRGLSASVRRDIQEVKERTTSESSSLWIKGSLPKGLDLRSLETSLGRFPILWRPTPLNNALRDLSWSGHAELILTLRDRARLQAGMIALDSDTADQKKLLEPKPIGLTPCLFERKESILARGVGNFEIPATENLLYLDEEVLRPLTMVAISGRTLDQLTDEQRDRIASAASAARVLGYRLDVMYDSIQKANYFFLAEQTEKPLGWGTYILRLGEAADYGVEVPRPLAEQQTYEYGVALFHAINARLLMLAGAHPHANPDGSSDVTRTSNAANVFNLVRQVVLREADPRPWRQVQVRASNTPGEQDVLMAPADPIVDVRVWFEPVLEHLNQQKLSVGYVDGAQETAGYEFDNLFLKRAFRLSTNGQAVLLWLSPNVRRHYRQQNENTLQAARFAALGIPTLETSLEKHCVTISGIRPMPLTNEIRDTLSAYLETRDIVLLRNLQHHWPKADFTRIIDPDTSLAFLIVRQADTLLVVRLAEPAFGAPKPFRSNDLSPTTLERFTPSRAPWLEAKPLVPNNRGITP